MPAFRWDALVWEESTRGAAVARSRGDYEVVGRGLKRRSLFWWVRVAMTRARARRVSREFRGRTSSEPISCLADKRNMEALCG